MLPSIGGAQPQAMLKESSYKKVYKIIVIGDSSVGKTSLTYRFCEGAFLEHAEATIGVDFRSKTIEIDGEEITVCKSYVLNNNYD